MLTWLSSRTLHDGCHHPVLDACQSASKVLLGDRRGHPQVLRPNPSPDPLEVGATADCRSPHTGTDRQVPQGWTPGRWTLPRDAGGNTTRRRTLPLVGEHLSA